MTYNSFYASLLTRLLLLFLTLTGLAYLMVNGDRFFTIIFLALLALVQIILLFVYLNRTNRNLARFLLLLTQEDTSVVAWKDQVEKTFTGLHHSFRKVNEEINRIRFEKEKGAILLQRTIDHMSTGIIAIDDRGRVEISNQAALELFGLTSLQHMDELENAETGISKILGDLRYDSGHVINLKGKGSEELSILVRTSLIKLEERTLRLHSLQNIKNQLEANEIESWQKMTRVLSHEISNSVTPLSTLGAGIHRKLSQGKLDKEGRMILTQNASRDLLQSARLLEQRGDALVDFMEHYKSFARIPDPVLERVDINSFFDQLGLLFREELEVAGIHLELHRTKASFSIMADRNLLEQAFLNLIKNASEALKEQKDGNINLEAIREKDRHVILRVSDNGPGIPEEIQSQVFIPFFTTKRGGTGIGMSIVRKIIVMSGGSIHFHSTPDRGTIIDVIMPEY